MRSPVATFDLRASLSDEINSAIVELSASPLHAKAVHRCRVHLKRARALARVGRACAPGLAAVFNETARSAMHQLAQARDLAALADASRNLAKEYPKKSKSAFEAIAQKLDAARAALPPLNPEAVRTHLRDLLALAQVWPDASARQIEKGADRIARRARRACRRGRNAEAPIRRHEWRKREKDRFYAATLLGKSWPEDRKRRLRQGERLGEVLGRERDALLLIERLEADPELAGGGKGQRRVLDALRKRARMLSGRADTIGAKLHRDGA